MTVTFVVSCGRRLCAATCGVGQHPAAASGTRTSLTGEQDAAAIEARVAAELVNRADSADGVGALTAQTQLTPAALQTQPSTTVEQFCAHSASLEVRLHFEREVGLVAAAHVFSAHKAQT